MGARATDEVPSVVRRLAGDRPVAAVWRNELGGLTFRIGASEFVKWFPGKHWEVDLAAEADRMRWAGERLPVPAVVDHGRADGAQWLRTVAMPFESAVHPRNVGDPERVVPALGRGLRRWHDALEPAVCPYAWEVVDRLSARPGLDPVIREGLLAQAPATRGVDRVVCHGDACSPNFLVDDHRIAGYVDLGRVGVGSRWADLAPALMSLEWNFGPGWSSRFLDAYEIDPDAERLAYYRRLWEIA